MPAAHIYSIGLTSPLGNFHDSCAAARAGLSRFCDHTHMATMFVSDDEATPLTIARSADVYEGYQGVGRRVKLLVSAFEDLKQQLNGHSLPEALDLFFATPDPQQRALEDFDNDETTPREKRLSDYANKILDPFYQHCEPALANKAIQLVFGERIAFSRLLRKAENSIAKGRFCLLLMVDSFLDESLLQELITNGLIKTADQPTGFVPSEGAACILLGPPSSSTLGTTLTIQTQFETVIPSNTNLTAQEQSQETSDQEEALIQIDPKDWDATRLYSQVQPMLEVNKETRTAISLCSDMNGEEYRAMEFGQLQVLLKRDFPRLMVLDTEPSAISFGNAGLLAGVNAFCMAVASFQRKYAVCNEHIVLLSDLDGRRGAIKIANIQGYKNELR